MDAVSASFPSGQDGQLVGYSPNEVPAPMLYAVGPAFGTGNIRSNPGATPL